MILIQDTLNGKTKKVKTATKPQKVKEVEVSNDEDEESYEDILKQFKEMRKAKNGKD